MATSEAVKKVEGSQHLDQLRACGLLTSQRTTPAAIKAVVPSGSCDKIVHFVRHGQAYHNLFAEMYREQGHDLDSTGEKGGPTPYTRPELVDPPLTEKGRQQAKDAFRIASETSPELIVSSPLRRAVETCVMAYRGHSGVPRVFHEDVREQAGKHTCDKRRDTEEIVAEFPLFDASAIPERDVLWTEVRESKKELADRGASFMQWLKARPERNIAVVTHSAWLAALLNCVVDCSGCPEYAAWFGTGELRSVGLVWN
eukprot:TRINITY_DN16370_c0_g1_i1.p1 TRINITY_DN16370_c0_g1~~TRINITY_DN16370_c0_g1_i1.p1  ORF type:complete len:256 (+),score=46.50 TRINITY_DN16370_c0_g1_i1:127-894(+)